MYRSTGASFAKAQAEFAHGVMSNRTVQETAGNAAAAAARNAVNQSTSGGRWVLDSVVGDFFFNVFTLIYSSVDAFCRELLLLRC